MKAYNIKNYGEPAKVLKLIETEQPVPNNTEVQVIDGPYAFEKIPWAIQRFGDGLHNGKIVISVN